MKKFDYIFFLSCRVPEANKKGDVDESAEQYETVTEPEGAEALASSNLDAKE